MERVSNSEENQQVRRSAGAMAVGTLGSRFLGLFRDIALAALFPNMVKDAFVVAFRLPNLFRRLLGEGSLSVSFIPVYVDQLNNENQQAARELAGSIWAILMMVTSVLCALGVIFMPSVMEVLVPGKQYQSIPGKVDLTILLARVMFLYLFLVTSYAFLMAVCQSHKRFFGPAVAPAFFNLMVIVFALIPDAYVGGISGMQLAIGVLVGGFVQLFMVVWQLKSIDRLPRLTVRFRRPGVKTILLNMLPGLAGLGVIQLIGIVNVIFASRLEQGSHSYIYFADRILELPMSLIAISLGSALLPTLSAQWATGRVAEMSETCLAQVKLLLFLSVPCALGMFFLAEPIVVLLFKWGEFGKADVEATMWVIKIYSFLLLASSFVRVFVPSFYAIKNTWYPAVVSMICLVFHVFMAPVLMKDFALNGIVLSLVGTGYINGLLLLLGYFLFIGHFPLRGLIKYFAVLCLPALAMGLYLSLFLNITVNFLEPMHFISASVNVIGGGLSSLFVYGFIAYILKNEEVQSAISIFRRKIMRKPQ